MTVVPRSRTLLGAFLGIASIAGLVGFAACAPGWNMVSTDPGLYPIFQLSVIDYVNRCDPNEPTDVTVNAPSGTNVSVDGQPPRSGTFTTQVDQNVNESFTLVVSSASSTSTHYVRCLPVNFPEWQALRSGTPQTDFYATVIVEGFGPNNVPVIFDTNGVPVWWTEPQPTFLLAPLPNGNLATLNIGGGMVERRLDGSVARLLDTQGASSDFHDVLLLPNGNYVLATLERRPCDLSPWGEGPGVCAFHDFQELTPTGQVVWNWRPEDEIPISETPARWRAVRDPQGTVDPWHYNSVEWAGDGFIISFRHMNAIYKIDYATKKVVWKLGGSARQERLQVFGDPVFDTGGSISGQHDARLLPGGVVTLFDNGTGTGRAPRSVAYRIDERAGTATLVNQVTDSVSPISLCCGSTRVLPGGNFVTGWGGSPWITENRPDGTQVFKLDARFVYRGIPLGPGWQTRDQLRAGMDVQFDGAATAVASEEGVNPPDRDELDIAFRLGLPPGAELGD